MKPQLLSDLSTTFILALFGFAIGYFFTKLKNQKTDVPSRGAIVKLRGPGGLFRSRFINESEEGWWLEPAIFSADLNPLNIGDLVNGQAETGHGVIRFQSSVRYLDEHGVLVNKPKWTAKRDRREEPRKCYGSQLASLDNESGQLLDLSPLGARVKVASTFKRGAQVRFVIDGTFVNVDGYVLACNEGVARVRFDSRITMPNL